MQALQKKHLFICFLILLLQFIITAQLKPVDPTRGFGNNKTLLYPEGGMIREVSLYDNSYALVIGMNEYKYWKKLKGPQKDVESVREVLKEHGFNVDVKMDLT